MKQNHLNMQEKTGRCLFKDELSIWLHNLIVEGYGGSLISESFAHEILRISL